ncbi:MAG: PQQ-binding-like beta-propeller repeat protein [Verrucomicrobiales bacterium]|jgi:outer membrane protein assembly factor BamB
MLSLRNLSLLSSLTIITASAALAEMPAWTGMLGPKRNGWVESYKVPETWPTKIESVWQTKVGTGYGTPLVVGDRIFQHARVGDDEVLSCLDLSNGKLLWQSKDEGVAFKMGGGASFHGKGPKSNPVYADGRVFTMSIVGVLTGYDAKTGKQLWRRDYRSEFEQNHPYWGVSTSPIVDGNQLIAHVGNDEAGTLLGLDVETGKEIWRQGKDGTDYNSPLILEIEGVRQIVMWTHEDVIGVESQTGKRLWDFHYPHRGNQQNTPTPVFHQGRLIVGGEGRGIKCLEPKRNSETGEWKVTLLWHQEEVSLDMSSAILNDSCVYGISEYKMGRFFCLDPATGKVHWQTRGREGEHAGFLSVPGHVLALTNTGTLKILKATPEKYEEVISYEVANSPTWAPPVLMADGLLIKGHDTLQRWIFKP